jgi:hypothetical protein
MSLFDTILSKLGVGSSKAAPPPPAPATQQRPTGSTTAAQPAPRATQSQPTQSTPPATTAAPAQSSAAPVDVAAVLEQRAAANPQKLNWRTSIVDLLKLLDMDSSLTARKALATELGCPTDLMGDSAKMNMWLHKTVLARVAANGGKVPQDLLH